MNVCIMRVMSHKEIAVCISATNAVVIVRLQEPIPEECMAMARTVKPFKPVPAIVEINEMDMKLHEFDGRIVQVEWPVPAAVTRTTRPLWGSRERT
jgi:hypothetical protein